MNEEKVTPGELAGLAALLAVFFLISFVTYSHLGEDAFISFRYARNFAHGEGLAFNPGERVEGYSNLLWVLIVAPFEWLGIRLHVAARIVSTLFFAGLIVSGWAAARRLIPREEPAWLRWWLPVALALEPYLHTHNDRGLETVPYAALLAGVLFTLGAGGSVWLAGAFGAAAALMRPEGIGFVLAMTPVAAMSRREKFSLEDCAKFAALPLAAFFAQLIFRRLYYHEWVPNTMIAKHPGSLNANEIIALICSHAFVPVIGIAGSILALRERQMKPLAVGCLLSLAASAIFSIKASGVLNEAFRYLIPAMVPSVVGVWLLVYTLRKMKPAPVAAAFLLMLVPVTIFVLGRDGNPHFFRGNGDAPRSRLLPRLVEKETWNLPERARWYFHDPIYINAEAGRWVAKNLPPDALVGADQIGEFGFYAGKDQRILDLLGLADRSIAHNGLTVDYIKAQAPDFLVVQTNDDSSYWPKAERLRPSVPWLADFFSSEDLKTIYRPRYFLRSPFMKIGFMVHERTGRGGDVPMQDITIGVDEAEFERWWRVKATQNEESKMMK